MFQLHRKCVRTKFGAIVSRCTKLGSYALSVQARKPKREQLCCLQRDSDESTASFVKTPLGLRGFRSTSLFSSGYALLEVHCLHRKCVRTPKPRKSHFSCEWSYHAIGSRLFCRMRTLSARSNRRSEHGEQNSPLTRRTRDDSGQNHTI